MSLEEFSLGRGIAYHGTDAGSARVLSGLRVNRPQEPSKIRTGFSSTSLSTQGRGDEYPRLYGPGLYVTGSKKHAKSYADDYSSGALVSGELQAKSPVSMQFEELTNLAEDPKVRKISDKLLGKKPHLGEPMFVPFSDPSGPSLGHVYKDLVEKLGVKTPRDLIEKHGIYPKRAYEMFTHIQHIGTHIGSSRSVIDPNKGKPYETLYPAKGSFAVKSDGSPLLGSDLAGVNIHLRKEGHDYLHVPETPKLYNDSAVILRPRAFTPRSVEFYTGATEHIK